MYLDDFTTICINRGMTLDEGYCLYELYKQNKPGPHPKMDIQSMKRLMDRGHYADGRPSQEICSAFADAEQTCGDGSKHQQTVEIHGETERITSKVKRKELAYSPLLDGITASMCDVLTDYTVNAREKKKREDWLKFFNMDADLFHYYLTWLHMFPSENAEKNAGWEKLFFAKYTNVQLRISSKGALRTFKATARKCDLRVYLIGTYMFIRSHINDGKCYIPKIENFLKVHEEWYGFAQDAIEELGDNLALMFDSNYDPSKKGAAQEYAGGTLA